MMKKEYITPDVKISIFDTEDIVCESSADVPTPERLITNGVSTGNKMATQINFITQ